MAAYGLYTHIRANRVRSVFLLIELFLLVYLLTYAGALLAEALLGDASLGWLLQAAARDLVMALPFVTVGTLLWILIAFASGLNPQQYAISVTQGLLDSLDDAEVEAVLGHELTHIRNGDVRMMVIAVVIAGALS